VKKRLKYDNSWSVGLEAAIT